MSEAVPFIDLAAQRRRLDGRIDRAIARVIERGAFIMGPEVAMLEAKLSAFCGARHAITCGNGTDAIILALMALGVGQGDAVFLPSFTFAASAEAVALRGATPVFIDVLSDSFNIDPTLLEPAVGVAERLGLRPRAVIPVDLFGQPADYRRLLPIAARLGLLVIADGAQSFGGSLDGRRVGGFGRITTTSFFPAKPLGCYGDGGALLTDDEELATVLRSIRAHGQGSGKYDNVRLGLNSRLDT
jgi:dTDP-4-amino-4,6-dideoxygalactose transaminase